MRPDSLTELSRISNWQKSGKRIVFTNGCFDIIHVGHLRYLTEARALGDILVIGLNSDLSVKGLKGPERPVVREGERREILLGLKPVDAVCIFDEETPFELIKAVQPDILVKGGDWPVEKIVGSDVVLARGGVVKSLAFYQGHSSTGIIEKIKKL